MSREILTMKKAILQNRGFTLVELVVALAITTILTGIILSLFSQSLSWYSYAKDRQVSDVYFLFYDIKRDVVLASQIISPNNSKIDITRIDGCTITYEKTGSQVKKSITGTGCKDRTLIVSNVENFNVSALGSDIYKISLKKADENFTHTIVVRKP